MSALKIIKELVSKREILPDYILRQTEREFFDSIPPSIIQQFNYDDFHFDKQNIIKRLYTIIRNDNRLHLDAGTRDIRGILAEYIPLPQYKRILIIGCGWGVEVYYATIIGYDAYGITLGITNVMYAKDVLGLSKIIRSDMHSMPFNDDYFDAIISFDCFEHSPCLLLLLIECHRILRYDGIIYVYTPASKSQAEAYGGIDHKLCPTPRQAKTLYIATGFDDISLLIQGKHHFQHELDDSLLDDYSSDIAIIAYKKREALL